jgi:hypothetical protein
MSCSTPEQLRQIRTAGDDSFLLVADLTSGWHMRNGEAFSVNLYPLCSEPPRVCGPDVPSHRRRIPAGAGSTRGWPS